MEQPALLEMRNITKAFPGVKALDDVSLTVRPGTVHALMGENGAGKSTLMKCLFGIYNKDAGTIVLDGKEVDFKSSKEALENGVAMVHQELNQALTRSVMDNLWLGRYPKVAGLMVSEGTCTSTPGRSLRSWMSTWTPRPSCPPCPFPSGRWWRSPRRSATTRRSSCSTSPPPL